MSEISSFTRPKKALVLAAGYGERLRPLTDVTPKPLLPVWGEPMLERILKMLEDWGVEEIAVNAHHLSEQIVAYCQARKGKAKLHVSVETEILGTGGAMVPLKEFFENEPFWRVNGDLVIEELDPKLVLEAFARSGGFGACWLTEAGPRTVEADNEGRICNWHSEDAGAPGTYTYTGLALLSPAIFDYLPSAGASSLIDAYEKAMMTDAKFVVGAVVNEAFWWDAGTPEAFRKVNDGPQPAELFRNPRLDALVKALGWDDAGADFLGARGSDRAFWRLDRASGASAIAIEYDSAKRPENARYAACAALLAASGVPVPQVYADLPEERMLALEELGAGDLQARAAKVKGAALVKLYTPVVKALKTMHVKATELALERDAALEPAFGPELYAWERDLFADYCVKARYQLELPAAVKSELEGVAAEFGRMPMVLLHRDCQSSNVLFRADGSFGFIDFQGMRLGPAVYDLAALLYDPYSPNLGEAERAALLKVYGGVSARELALGAVERLVQTLGAFGRLASVGKHEFGKYVPRALINLLAAADDADLDGVGAFIEDLIAKEEIRLRGWQGHDHDGHGCTCGHDHAHEES